LSTNLNSALELAARGLPVFPVWWMAGGQCACRAGGFCKPGQGKHRECTPEVCTECHPGKHPITPSGLHDASTDPAKITRWWGIAPEANVGVAVPDGVVVIDVDPRNDGEATLAALQAQHGRLPITRTAATGGKGGHFYFAAPPGLQFPSTLGEGIDVKQFGGYVLAPPSNHESGGAYQWIGSPDAPLAQAPGWVLALGRPRGERSTVVIDDEDERTTDNETLDRIAALVEPQFVQGKMHHICKNLSGWLKQRGFSLADASYVIRRLPCRNTKNGLDAAKAAFAIDRPFGWTELRGLIGEAPAAALDTVTPNPRREGERAAAEGLVQAMAASAVTRAQAPAPALAMTPAAPAVLGQLPAWYRPVDIEQDPPPIDYIVKDLELAAGRANMIVGYSNAGKTIAAEALAFAIAMGLPAWGQFPVKRRKVLYLDAESIIVTRENFARLAYAAGVSRSDLKQWLTVVDSRYYLDVPNAELELANVLQTQGYGAVFIDTFRASTPSLDENAKEVSIPLYMLGRISQALNVPITVLHHEKKTNDNKRASVEEMISGHASIHGALGVGISMIRDDESELISVRPSKRVRRGFKPFQLKIVDVGLENAGEAIGAGVSSPGVRVDYVGEAPAKPLNEDTLGAALLRVIVWLRANAGDGRQVRVDQVLRPLDLGGCGGKKQTNMAALERLERDRQIHMSGSPRMVALALDAPPYDPRSVAPPESVDKPSIQESLTEMHSAMGGSAA